MHYALAFLACLFVSFSSLAEENYTDLIMQKYGVPGKEKEAHLHKSHDEAVKPVSSVTHKYILSYKQDKSGEHAYLTSTVGKNSVCKTDKGNIYGDNGVSTEATVTETQYVLEKNGKAHKLLIRNTECLGSVYDFKKRKIIMGDANYSYVNVYLDRKPIVTQEIASGTAETWVYGGELIFRFEICCTMGQYFDRYDWATGQAIEKGALETSFDDLPSVPTPHLSEIIGSDGKPLSFVKEDK